MRISPGSDLKEVYRAAFIQQNIPIMTLSNITEYCRERLSSDPWKVEGKVTALINTVWAKTMCK